MYKEPLEFLKHISDECEYLLSVNKNLSKDDFLSDETMKRAVVRSLEIFGEATKKIPADFKVKWNTIQWKNMAGMRDRLIHDYVGVNYAIGNPAPRGRGRRRHGCCVRDCSGKPAA